METRMKKHLSYFSLGAAAVLLIVSAGLHAQSNGEPARYTAAVIDPNNGRSGMVEIAVSRWSSDAQREKLISIARDQGPEKLLDVLQDLPSVGYFRTPDSVGWDLHYARRTPQPDGGERVVLVTDRRIGFWETTHQTPSVDYPFTVIELRLNGDGRGEGRMSLATKIIVDKDENQITLENYEHQPVLLKDVRHSKP
jgi:hypothetical protein